MRQIMAVVVAGILLCLLGTMTAAQVPTGPSTTSGKFVKLDGQNLILLVTKGDAQTEITLKASDKVVILFNGKAATATDLKENMDVVATLAEGTVTKIEAKGATATTRSGKSGKHEKDDDD